jgi:8-oxo-dGTP pyrophosphatase MutT (NUDIX family)
VVSSLDEARRRLATHRPRALPIEGALKKAAVAAIFRERSAHGTLELLFIRRAERAGDPWSGHMAFPGGRVDPGDQGALAAARRETREEVGLDLDAVGELFAELSHQPAMAHGRPLPMVVVPFAFGLSTGAEPIPDAREVQEALWVPLDFLAAPENRGVLERPVAGLPMRLPCYRYEGRVIWGLTLKMLDELLAVLGPRPGSASGP